MRTLNLTEADINNIARMANAEAGSQGAKGMKAVTAVILNRVASGEFGRGVTGVLTAEGQFDPVRKTSLGSLPLTREAKDVVRSYLESGVQDPTHGATFFRAPYAKNKFNDPKTATLVVEGQNTRRNRKGQLVGDAHLFFDHYGNKKYEVPAFAVKYPGMTQLAQFGGTTGEAPTVLANAGDTIRETVHDTKRDVKRTGEAVINTSVRAGKKVAKTVKDIAVNTAHAQNAPITPLEKKVASATTSRHARRRALAELHEKPKHERGEHRVASRHHGHRYAASHHRHYAEGGHPHRRSRYSARERVAANDQFQGLAKDFGSYFREQAMLRGEPVVASPPQSRRAKFVHATPIRNDPGFG